MSNRESFRVGLRQDAIVAEIPRLRRYARALLGGGSESDDLVQDTLERGLAHVDQWTSGDNPRKWLFSILHNLHIDRLRQGARRPMHLGLDALSFSQSIPPADAMSTNELAQALHQIPVDQRQVLLLVGVEGFSYAEAASILGVPAGTVMSRLSRGREKLRALIDGDGTSKSGTSTIRRLK